MKSENRLQAVALRIVAILVMLSGLALGVVASSAPVLAHGTHSGDVTGYSISVEASPTDFNYVQHTFLKATLSYPASNPPTIVTGKSLSFSIDGQVYDSPPQVTETSPVVVFISSAVGGFLPGQHTVTATYTDLTTNTQVTSSPVTLTVEKLNGNSALNCQGPSFVATWQTMQFTVNLLYSSNTNNWTDATVTIKFVGPTTVVSAPQVIDYHASAQFTVSPPTQPGKYQIQCIFSGNNIYTPGELDLPLTVSSGYGVGGADLYSNPTSLHLNTTNPFMLYIVLHAAKGFPVPTGQVYVKFENGTYGPGTLNPDGTLLAAFKPTDPPGAASFSTITVVYMGDTTYGYQTRNFSQTNPPIPGNTASSGAGNLGSGATATPNPNATVTVTATVTAIATATTSSAASASNAPTASVPAGSDTNWALIVGLIVAVLALIGGFLVWRVRRAPLAPPMDPRGAQSQYSQYGQYGQNWQSSQYPQRDIGWNNSGAPTYPDQSQAPTPRYRPPADDAQW